MAFRMIMSHLDDKVLNVEFGKPEPGARIVLWSKDSSNPSNEMFAFQDAGEGWFHIASALDTNMVLDVEGGEQEAKEGARVILYEKKFPATPNQLFQWHGQTIRSMIGGPLGDFVLDVDGGRGEDGAGIIIWSHKAGYNQNQSWRVW